MTLCTTSAARVLANLAGRLRETCLISFLLMSGKRSMPIDQDASAAGEQPGAWCEKCPVVNSEPDEAACCATQARVNCHREGLRFELVQRQQLVIDQLGLVVTSLATRLCAYADVEQEGREYADGYECLVARLQTVSLLHRDHMTAHAKTLDVWLNPRLRHDKSSWCNCGDDSVATESGWGAGAKVTRRKK